MFNLDQFIEECKGKPASVVKELLAEALRDPASVKQALDKLMGNAMHGEFSLPV